MRKGSTLNTMISEPVFFIVPKAHHTQSISLLYLLLCPKHVFVYLTPYAQSAFSSSSLLAPKACIRRLSLSLHPECITPKACFLSISLRAPKTHHGQSIFLSISLSLVPRVCIHLSLLAPRGCFHLSFLMPKHDMPIAHYSCLCSRGKKEKKKRRETRTMKNYRATAKVSRTSGSAPRAMNFHGWWNPDLSQSKVWIYIHL